ncbi:MAG: hypothetical protein RL641_4 [Candidatus Parcubacteria bacterium]|jgi:hypothetical protein
MFEKVTNEPSPFNVPDKHDKIPNQFSCEEFGIPSTEFMTKDQKLQYLAQILVKWYVSTYEENEIFS